MADEEKIEGTPNEPENTPEPDSQPDGTPPKDDAGGKIDYEKRYIDLQREHTLVAQEKAELERQIEALEQAGPETPPDDDFSDDDGFVDRKTASNMIDKAVKKAVSQVRTETAYRYFRKTYPDHVKYEGVIAGIMRNPSKPLRRGASAEDSIDAAVEEFKALTEEAKATARAEADAEAKAREEKNSQASGLTSSSTTTPKSGEEELSEEEELKERKRNQAKKSGLI